MAIKFLTISTRMFGGFNYKRLICTSLIEFTQIPTGTRLFPVYMSKMCNTLLCLYIYIYIYIYIHISIYRLSFLREREIFSRSYT